MEALLSEGGVLLQKIFLQGNIKLMFVPASPFDAVSITTFSVIFSNLHHP